MLNTVYILQNSAFHPSHPIFCSEIHCDGHLIPFPLILRAHTDFQKQITMNEH